MHEAAKFLREDRFEDPVKPLRIEEHYGYDIIDNKSYRETVPDEAKFDYMR